MKENCKNEKVLQVIRETEILGKDFEVYGQRGPAGNTV